MMGRLKTGHHFPLTPDDETRIRSIYLTFLREGVMNFSASFLSPGYAALKTTTDGAGKNWSYLVIWQRKKATIGFAPCIRRTSSFRSSATLLDRRRFE